MHLDAEIVALGVHRGERGEMLAVAEADLERTRRATSEQCIEIERRRCVFDAVTRPQIFQRAGLTRRHATGTHDEAANRTVWCFLGVGAHRGSASYRCANASDAASSAASQCAAESPSAPSVTYFAQAKRAPCATHTRASAKASMSTTSPSCGAVAKESAVEQSVCGRPANTVGNSMTAGVASNGVTPRGNPSPVTSMSRCANRLHATSECAGSTRLPAVPRFT